MWGVEVKLFTPRPAYPWERTTARIGGWVGPRTGLDGFGEKKIILSLLRFEPETIHAVASRYTDYSGSAPAGLSFLLSFQ